MARKAGLVAVLAGTADIIPLGRIVSRVGRVPAMRMTGKLLNVLTEVAEQGLKSGGQQTTNNLIAQHYYDANRGLFDEVIEASGGSLTPTLVISLLQMTAARGWHVREGQLRKKWQGEAPAESGAVSREASPGAAPETESKGKLPAEPAQTGEDASAAVARAGQKKSGVSREQAKQWVDEILRKWGSELDVTVHESAETIPDAALRDRVLKEGDVDGIFNGSDGKIHILADRVDSASGTERLLKHEGFHWAVGGKLRVEYGQLVAEIGRRIPGDRMQEIIARYPKGTPELWVEEYLAHLAETNPQSPVWRQFVYEVKRLLRRVFGDRVEYTEQDIRAFLSKAQQRAARAKAADAAEFAKVQEGLRFAKGKPKGPQRRSWEEVRKGDRWASVKKLLPKENVEPTFFPAHGTQEEVVERAYQFITRNPIVTDWTGRTVYLPYGQTEGRFRDPVKNKAEHIIGYDLKQGTHQRILDREKAKWLGAVVETIRNGSVRVRGPRTVYYFRKYRDGRVHMVVTSSEGVLLEQGSFASGLVTQYPVNLNEETFLDAYVDARRPLPIAQQGPSQE